MNEIKNLARERLAQGKIILGFNARHSRTTEIGAIMRDCGFHWLFVDDEHTPSGPDRVYDTCLAALRAGVTPFIRVSHLDAAQISRQLSNGALGVIVPHVETPAQADAAARWSRYPPLGTLSVPGAFPHLGYKPVPFQEATEALNRETMVVIMLESGKAIENAEAIAEVPGVDVLFIGASDLSYDLGVRAQYGHPKVAAAVERVCKAARAQGKFCGMGGPKAAEDWKRYMRMGMRMIMAENDLSMLVARMRERAEFFTGIPLE
ncbi:MAG: aldolase [Proteobacteria bacterium]|nr:aldolase [Pseudomonadota bacterium]